MLAQEVPTVGMRWPMLRVKAGSRVQFSLLSGEWVRLTTHFHQRTFLCAEGDDCEACSVLPARAFWYLPILVASDRRKALVELSATAAAELEERSRFVGSTIREGLEVEVSRRTAKSRLVIDVCGTAALSLQAKLYEWATPLMAIYGLPPLRPGESVVTYGERVRPAVIERAKVQASFVRHAAETRAKGRR